MSSDHSPDATGPGTIPQLGTPPSHLLGNSPADADSLLPRAPDVGGSERYELIEEIARGGMGAVWRARDRVLGREVGVKTLLRVPSEGSALPPRFRTEAHITGQLQHPNIPPVHDLGTLPDGRPFLAMKLIKGRTLEALLKERPDPAHDRGRFIAIFEQIAQGVAYAHAHRVIHRDLKPLNVMVGAFGEVQVMDWGLAKVLTTQTTISTSGSAALPPRLLAASEIDTAAETEIRPLGTDVEGTRAGSVMGTPAYMPREQAIGAVDQIDTRSDVFSLGGILCTILTGKPPYVGGDAETTRQLAAVAKLDDTYARLDTCGAEPDLIALAKRCLSAERADRPKDAEQVAKAVAELRADAEQRARQAEVERARVEEQARRRRVVQAAGGLIVLVLLVGLGVSIWQMVRAIDAEGESRKNENQARLNAEEADRNARNARAERDAKDVALQGEKQARKDEAQARERALGALRAMTDEVVERKFAQGQGYVLTVEDKAFLFSVLKQWEAFAGVGGDDLNSRSVRGEGRFRVGLMRHRLGDPKEAEADYDAAHAIQKLLAAENPDRPEFRQQLAHTLNNRGNLVVSTGQLQKAEDDYHAALELYRQLAADFPTRPEFQEQLSASYLNRATLFQTTGRLKEAEADYDTSLAIQKLLVEDHPDRFEFRQQLAMTLNNRGALLRATGRLKEAQADYDDALTLYKDLTTEYPARPEFRQQQAGIYINRGNLLRALGRLTQAEADYNASLALYKQLAADFPTRPEYRQQLSASHNNRGNLLASRGRLKEAEADYNAALALYKQLADDFPTRPEFRHQLSSSHNNRGILLVAMGRLKEAEADYDAAVALQKQLADDFPTRSDFRMELAVSYNNRASLRHDTNRLKEAEADYGAALAIQTQLADDFPTRPDVRQELAKCHCNRAAVLNALGRPKDAAADYDAALAIQTQLADDFPTRPDFRQDLARSHYNRGNMLRLRGRPKEAEADYTSAVTLYKQLAADFPTRPDFHHELARSHSNRGLVLHSLGRPKESEADFNAALGLYKQLAADFPIQPVYRQELAGCHNGLGVLHLDQNQYALAIASARDAIKADPTLSTAHAMLGFALQKSGDISGAREAFTEAARLEKRWEALLKQLPPPPIAPPPREAEQP